MTHHEPDHEPTTQPSGVGGEETDAPACASFVGNHMYRIKIKQIISSPARTRTRAPTHTALSARSFPFRRMRIDATGRYDPISDIDI